MHAGSPGSTLHIGVPDWMVETGDVPPLEPGATIRLGITTATAKVLKVGTISLSDELIRPMTSPASEANLLGRSNEYGGQFWYWIQGTVLTVNEFQLVDEGEKLEVLLSVHDLRLLARLPRMRLKRGMSVTVESNLAAIAEYEYSDFGIPVEVKQLWTIHSVEALDNGYSVEVSAPAGDWGADDAISG